MIESMGELGSRLIDGDGIKQDSSKGEKCLEKQLMSGYNEAMGDLALD